MPSVTDIRTKITNQLDQWNQDEETRKGRRKIEKEIETMLYNELQIVVLQGGVDSDKVEKIALLKDLVKMFKEPTEINVRCEGSS